MRGERRVTSYSFLHDSPVLLQLGRPLCLRDAAVATSGAREEEVTNLPDRFPLPPSHSLVLTTMTVFVRELIVQAVKEYRTLWW